MARRLDPPHDRVVLSLDELCALARLEESLADMDGMQERADEPRRRRRIRRWWARRRGRPS